MSTSISSPALHVPLPNWPLRNKASRPLFLLLKGHGNPSQWTTFWASRPPRGEMTVFCGCWSLFQDGNFDRLQEEHRSRAHYQDLLWTSMGTFWDPTIDTKRGVDQYQVQFKNLFQLILKPFNYIQWAMNNSIIFTPIHHNTPCTIYEK